MNEIDKFGKLICRFCDKSIEPQELSFVNSYWGGHGSFIKSFEHSGKTINVAAETKYPCHRSCKREGLRRQAYDCQCIDADCNDCKYFERDGDDLSLSPKSPVFTGLCLKFSKPTRACPQLCTMHSCFEHRRNDEYIVIGLAT